MGEPTPATMKGLALAVARALRASLARRSGPAWSFPTRIRWEWAIGALGRYVVCSTGERCTFAVWVDRLKPGGRRTRPILAVSFDFPSDPGLPTALANRVRSRRITYGMGEKSGVRRSAYGEGTVVETDGAKRLYLTRYWADAPDPRVAAREAAAFFSRWKGLAQGIEAYEWPPIGREELSSRRRARVDVLRRRGQQAFRAALLKAYQGRCAVSGCSVLDVLEAAHIEGYAKGKTHAVENGLLLRSDLHSLFDLGLVGIDPDTMRVVLFRGLDQTEYREYRDKKIRLPQRKALGPDRRKLGEHLAWCRSLSENQ